MVGDTASARAKVAESVGALLAMQGTNGEKRLALFVELGAFAQEAGVLATARRVREYVLEVRSRLLSQDDLDILAARRDLALTVKAEGDLHGALSMQQSVLEAHARVLPSEDPELLPMEGSVAATQARLGDLEGAQQWIEQVVEDLGPRRPVRAARAERVTKPRPPRTAEGSPRACRREGDPSGGIGL